MLSLILYSCHSGAGLKENENKEVIRSYFEEVWNKGDLESIEKLTPPVFLFHYQGQDLEAGYEDHKEVVKYWRNGFPDYQVQLEEIVAEERMVVARYHFTGTHKREILGIPPTGNTIRVSGMWMCNVENGQLVECWEEYDHYTLLKQISDTVIVK